MVNRTPSKVGAYVVRDVALPHVSLVHPKTLAHAEVSCFGATVLGWEVNRAKIIYSARSDDLMSREPFKGGIPVAFPQWGTDGVMREHGFACRMRWEIEEKKDEPNPSVTFVLKSSDDIKPFFEKDFELRNTITIFPEELRQEIRVKNTGKEPLSWTGGYVNHLVLPTMAETKLSGLKNELYYDLLDGGKEKTTKDTVIDLKSYNSIDLFKSAKDILVSPMSSDGSIVLTIRRENFPNCAIDGNKTKTFSRTYACEPMIKIHSCVVKDAITIDPGHEWIGAQVLTCEKFEHSEEDVRINQR
eukprot:GHVP01041117.1.p1 GENE.GHVP01041117.1~~GHVP01041117.1.p1  ORF type:complete len:301 (+),score=38.54 GHVP01041117.1:279-1181(+)